LDNIRNNKGQWGRFQVGGGELTQWANRAIQVPVYLEDGCTKKGVAGRKIAKKFIKKGGAGRPGDSWGVWDGA